MAATSSLNSTKELIPDTYVKSNYDSLLSDSDTYDKARTTLAVEYHARDYPLSVIVLPRGAG